MALLIIASVGDGPEVLRLGGSEALRLDGPEAVRLGGHQALRLDGSEALNVYLNRFVHFYKNCRPTFPVVWQRSSGTK